MPARRLVHRRGGSRALRARRAQGRRREGDGSAGRGPDEGRAVRQPRGFRRPDRPAPAQPPPAGKPRRGWRVRRDQAGAGRGVRRRRDDPCSRGVGAGAARNGPGRPVRRQLGRGRADPPAARRIMDSRAAHGGGTGGVRLLFLRASGRCRQAPARRAQGQDLCRARRRPDRRGRACRRDDGRPGRGHALANLGARAPLHDGDSQRQLGPVHGDGVRR